MASPDAPYSVEAIRREAAAVKEQDTMQAAVFDSANPRHVTGLFDHAADLLEVQSSYYSGGLSPKVGRALGGMVTREKGAVVWRPETLAMSAIVGSRKPPTVREIVDGYAGDLGTRNKDAYIGLYNFVRAGVAEVVECAYSAPDPLLRRALRLGYDDEGTATIMFTGFGQTIPRVSTTQGTSTGSDFEAGLARAD